MDKSDVLGSVEEIPSVKVGDRVYKYKTDLTVTHRKFWQELAEEGPFLDTFIATLRNSPFKAYFFETPYVNNEIIDTQFEFVLVEAPQLYNAPEDRRAFSEHFSDSHRSAVKFSNLGADASLVAPRPLSDSPVYTHLAVFMNKASSPEVKEFWSLAGQTALETINHRKRQPVWISTSGLGVYWLHLRFDSRPKYYQYDPYSNF